MRILLQSRSHDERVTAMVHDGSLPRRPLLDLGGGVWV
jgi:hypothetical protein